MRHCKVTFLPENITISIHAGATVVEAAGQAGIILNMACGGQGTCGKCAVRLGDGKEVLACRFSIAGDTEVFIPSGARFFEQRILKDGQREKVESIPAVVKKFVPGRIDCIDALVSFIRQAEPHSDYQPGHDICEQLKSICPDHDLSAGVTAVCFAQSDRWTICAVERGDTSSQLYGVAVDIGTTTIVAKLMDLCTGTSVATASSTNPQIKFGDDVISRIVLASSVAGLKQLQDVIIDCLCSLIKQLCQTAQIPTDRLYEVVAVGNTTMNHLLLGFPVRSLGQAPYNAYSTDPHNRPVSEIMLNINPCGNLHTVANIAGFVGADTTAAALAAGLDTEDKLTLLVDIGTNGEIVLGAGDTFYAASCAAGPALEGARISCGSRAVTGAIERVLFDGRDIDVDVIGDGAAVSLCGSGLIDAIAVLLELGIIDQTGRFADYDMISKNLPPAVFQRLIECDGQWAFLLAGRSGKEHGPVLLFQKDIRQTQLAKAAIRAGIVLLEKKLGVKDSDIQQVMLAGAFGNYIDPQNAMRIKMLPEVELPKIHFIGNAACAGAEMVLLNRKYRTAATYLSRKIRYVEIAYEADFNEVFTDSLMF